jgi:hypothetical protein
MVSSLLLSLTDCPSFINGEELANLEPLYRNLRFILSITFWLSSRLGVPREKIVLARVVSLNENGTDECSAVV